MTMVSSGEISIGGSATSGGLNRSINIELGRSATTSSNLNESALRTLAGVPSGTISLSNFYGKSNAFTFTISSNQSNANLRTLAVNAGWNQSSAVVATVNPGVQIRSTAVGTPALTINGAWPGGVRLNNSGVIIGQGGAGGTGGNGVGYPIFAPNYRGQAGFAGGTALTVSVPVTIQNNGTIGGGGGGGGGSGYFECSCGYNFPSGGGGGGAGFGAGGIKGRNIVFTSTTPTGSAGGQLTGGAGGPGECWQYAPNSFGGAGGSAGNNGAIGPAGGSNYSPGGPYLPNFYGNNTSSGGAAGPAVTGNSFISRAAFGTRLGPIS